MQKNIKKAFIGMIICGLILVFLCLKKNHSLHYLYDPFIVLGVIFGILLIYIVIKSKYWRKIFENHFGAILLSLVLIFLFVPMLCMMKQVVKNQESMIGKNNVLLNSDIRFKRPTSPPPLK